jgi:hypothetical protein
MTVLFLSATASAEFYKYYDEKGNLHFTDDYNKVPVDQRPNVRGYEEYQNLDEEEKSTGDITQEENVQSSETETEKEEKYDFDARVEEFDKIKQELSREYDVLMQENEKLAEEKKSVKTADDIKRYNEQVANLNKKIAEHDRKRKEFFATIEAHNEKVAKENVKRTKK